MEYWEVSLQPKINGVDYRSLTVIIHGIPRGKLITKHKWCCAMREIFWIKSHIYLYDSNLWQVLNLWHNQNLGQRWRFKRQTKFFVFSNLWQILKLRKKVTCNVTKNNVRSVNLRMQKFSSSPVGIWTPATEISWP